MAVVVKTLVPAKHIENVQTTQYTASNAKAVIGKATVTNTSSTNETISVNLVSGGEIVSNSNLIVDNQLIGVGECYELTEIAGHSIDANGFISTIASTSNSLVLMISGSEIT